MIITKTRIWAALMSASLIAAGTITATAPALAQGMSANEAKGAGISGQWRGSRGLVTKGPDGKVIFLFGEVQPSVVCSPLQLSLIHI